ncbi:SIR2 family protein, partial [Ralstonia solanacearum]|uniref:SIR2 family protein n=1 Tax=Ralstonia solanacearum TaxID=305 RepID=UPI0006DCB53B
MTQKKKFVYFLGAGASYGAGASATVQAGGKVPIPTQATFWDTFLRFCRSAQCRSDIESFLFRYFLGYGRTPTRLKPPARRKLLAQINVEEVFTFVSERASAPSTTPQLRTYTSGIWAALTAEIGNVFGRFEPNAQTRATYRALIKNHFRSFDAIVSFNYDTIFERSLPSARKPRYLGIDGNRGDIPLLKPHGSVNWTRSKDGSIVVFDNPPSSVIVAPTHLKFVPTGTESEHVHAGYLDQADEIRQIWSEMEAHMKGARALVFIGYSFPQADLYFSSVLRSVLADRETTPDIVIVNPDAVAIADRLRESPRYS